MELGRKGMENAEKSLKINNKMESFNVLMREKKRMKWGRKRLENTK